MAAYELIANSTALYLGGICIFLLALYDYWNKLYFKRHGIPGPFPLPIVGTFFAVAKGLTTGFVTKKEKYGKVYGLALATNTFVIHDLDMIKEIMISQFSSFPNHTPPTFGEKPFDKGVNVITDGHWKTVRNTLTPAFSGSKMKQMTPLINGCCDQLVEHFDELRKTESSIQCKDLFGAYSMDVVATTFFGMHIDSQKNPDDPFVKYAKEGFNINLFSGKRLLLILFPFLKKVFRFLGIKVMNPAVGGFFQDVITRTMELRKAESSKRKDMLQLMIDAHTLDTKDEDENDELVNGVIDAELSPPMSSKSALTADEIMANAFIFFLAGYETTNTCLCMTSYLLATNKEHQEKLIQEVDKYAPRKEDVTYNVIGQMEYLDGVVRESLRIYPPAAGTNRVNDKKDIVVKGITIPKGFSVLIPIYAIHHDPEIWEDPETFRPERFYKENSGNIQPVSWLPFGDGPRRCLGMRLAVMEIKFALVRMLQEFKFETCSETEIPPCLNNKSGFSCPPNGVKLQVVPRKKTE